MYNSYINPYGYGTMNNMQGYGYPLNPYYNSLSNINHNQTTQQQEQTSQTNTNTPKVNTNKIFVNGIEDVKNRILPPYSEVIFLDNDKPLLYEKKVDGAGKMEIRTLSLLDYVEDTKAKELNNLSDFVKKDDFEAFKAEFRAYQGKIAKMSIQNEIDSIKNDSQPRQKQNKNSYQNN